MKSNVIGKYFDKKICVDKRSFELNNWRPSDAIRSQLIDASSYNEYDESRSL